MAPLFSVPASAPDPDGFDTGYAVSNSVTLDASGMWSDDNGTDPCPPCQSADGIAPSGDQSLWLAPGLNAFSLVGRIGTGGPWTEVGSGPSTLNGSGELYLAMNDQLSGYADNSGSLAVSVVSSLNSTTSYSTAGPVLADAPFGWQGSLTNTDSTPITGGTVYASAGTQLQGSQTSVPTWQELDSDHDALTSPASCSATALGSPVYECAVGEVAPGDSIAVAGSVLSQGVKPQTLTDELSLVTSDATGDCVSACVAPSAPAANQEVDGVLFGIPVAASIVAGTPIVTNGTITNSTATQTIHSITAVAGSITTGSFSAVPFGCTITNNMPLGTGGSYSCPTPFNLAPGATIPGSVTVRTTGIGGHSLSYSIRAHSTDLGGNSYTTWERSRSCPRCHMAATLAPVAATITAGSDAGWTAQITNDSASPAQSVTVTWNGRRRRSLDLRSGRDQRRLGPARVDRNLRGGCGRHHRVQPARHPGRVGCAVHRVRDHQRAGAGNDHRAAVRDVDHRDTGPATLGTVTISGCTSSCTTGVAAPGDPFQSPAPTPTSPTAQVVTLTPNNAGSSTLPPVVGDIAIDHSEPCGVVIGSATVPDRGEPDTLLGPDLGADCAARQVHEPATPDP